MKRGNLILIGILLIVILVISGCGGATLPHCSLCETLCHEGGAIEFLGTEPIEGLENTYACRCNKYIYNELIEGYVKQIVKFPCIQ